MFVLTLLATIHCTNCLSVNQSDLDEKSHFPISLSNQSQEYFALKLGETRANLPHQSPIDLKRSTSLPIWLPALKFSHYETVIPTMMLTNTGATAMLSIPSNYPTSRLPSINRGGLFFNKYTFAQLHLHWGNSSLFGGSEHLIKSKRFAAEMHFVHYHDKYGSFTEALKYPNGVAVLAVLLDVKIFDNMSFEKIVNKLSDVTLANTTTYLSSPLRLSEFLPWNTKLFYRYYGSLTTPNYDEVVTWTVFETPLAVSERQVAALRTMLDYDGNPISSNYREVQPLNGRLILFNWRPKSFYVMG